MQKGYLQGDSVEGVTQMQREIENTNSDYQSRYDDMYKARKTELQSLKRKLTRFTSSGMKKRKKKWEKTAMVSNVFLLSRIKEEFIVIGEYCKEKASDFIGQTVQ